MIRAPPTLFLREISVKGWGLEMKSLIELVVLVQTDDDEAFMQIVTKFNPLLIHY